MIENFEEGFGYVIHCDICEEELYDMDAQDFRDMAAYAKEYGWISRKVDGEWEDVCPACQEID
jgi:hypothetical protein